MGDDAADLVRSDRPRSRAPTTGPDGHVGLALRRLAQDHPAGDLMLFNALLRAWLGWTGAMHCTACTRQLLEAAQDDLAAAQRQLCLH